jgi:hypothetical protein
MRPRKRVRESFPQSLMLGLPRRVDWKKRSAASFSASRPFIAGGGLEVSTRL